MFMRTVFAGALLVLIINNITIVTSDPDAKAINKNINDVQKTSESIQKALNGTSELIENMANKVVKGLDLAKKTSKFFSSVKKFAMGLVKISKFLAKFNAAASVVSSVVDIISMFTGGSENEESAGDQMNRLHKELMNAIGAMSNQIDDVNRDLHQGIDRVINDILNSLENIVDYKTIVSHIDKIYREINILYHESTKKRELFEQLHLSKQSMEAFEKTIFTTPSVEHMLNLFQSFFLTKTPISTISFLDIYKVYTEKKYSRMCNEESPHQQLYLIYSSILTMEMEGYAIQSHGYSLRSVLYNTIYEYEIRDMTQSAIDRMNSYVEKIVELMPSLSRELRTCNPKTAIRGATFIELENFVQLKVVTHLLFSLCSKPCSSTKEAFEDPFDVGDWIVCKSDNGPRLFEYIKPSGTEIYGKGRASCKEVSRKPYTFPAFYNEMTFWEKSILDFGIKPTRECKYCGFTRLTRHPVIIHPQLSTTESNMIITGVKFVRIDGVLAIQIKQGNLTADGVVLDNNQWEEVTGRNDTQDFNTNRREMFLDNVIVDPGYVITGVKLNVTKDNKAFKLIVRGTRYDYESGKLIHDNETWFDPEDGRKYTPDYHHERQRISVKDLGNPIHATEFQADPRTNQVIRFERSNLKEDAGQTTIPLLDAQPVVMTQAMPLNGIGLYYKEAKNYGGYLSLRLFTDSMERYIGAEAQNATLE